MKTGFYLALSTFVFLAVAPHAQAATLFTPDQGPYSTGQSFSMPVYVSTAPGEAINAVSGRLTFPSQKLRVKSVSKGGIMTFWVEDPTYSNASGIVSFEGGVYNPGFAGSRGTVVTVTFEALAAGNASVGLEGVSILANDGVGTDVTAGTEGSIIAIKEAPAAKSAPVQTPTASSSEVVPVPETTLIEAPTLAPAPMRASISREELIDAAWIALNYLSALLLFAAAASGIFFSLWYVWHRIHGTRRRLIKHLSATDTALHDELLELHAGLRDEVKKLRAEGEARDLTSHEKAMLKRLAHLVSKTEKSMAEHWVHPRR